MNDVDGKPDSMNPSESNHSASEEHFIPFADETVMLSRRRFLEAAGFAFSLTALQGCGRAPTETALPMVEQPEGMIPGRIKSYASTCAGCPAGCGMLVSVRDGRPLKMEGMPEHPLSRGGLCAVGQALPLGLYDSHRLQHPLQAGQKSDWKTVDRAIIEALENIDAEKGSVRFVTSTITSPTLRASIEAFLGRFADARHITFDALSCSSILDAHEKTHGVRSLPHYRFDQAKTIVSFGADFLGTWISPVEFTSAWRKRRIPHPEQPEMSYHAQLEGRLSLTGSNADRRYRVAPDEFGALLTRLNFKLSQRAVRPQFEQPAGHSPLPAAELDRLAERLWETRGESLVVCDSPRTDDQILVNSINHLLGNYGTTLDLERSSRQRQGNDREVLQLIDDLQSSRISALFVAGTDLTHNLPHREKLADAIRKVPLVVSFAEREDDFSSLAGFVCPDHHALESWLDAEPVAGQISLSQPTLQPLGDTRSILESLSRWSGRSESAYEIVRAHWQKDILPRAKDQLFRNFWDRSLHDGFIEVAHDAPQPTEFQSDVVKSAARSARGAGSDQFCLTLYHKVGLTDSRHAHNPWLQELPDPVTKATWDNYVCISPRTAEDMGIAQGDVVRVEVSSGEFIELPALIQRGQHDRVLSIALAYGVRGTDRFANIGPQWLEARPTVAPGETVGRNSAVLIDSSDGSFLNVRSDASLTRTERSRALATTQEYHSLELPSQVAPGGAEIREIVQETTLEEFIANPEAGKPEQHFEGAEQLWPEDHPKTGHWWGMAIDQNACTGCSACLIACQSENNVPVVGKDEVLRQREMHWIRLDRYYQGKDDDLTVSHQPMMCQHCDNAPCETVCPALATVHSEEGLNEQAYNRCVGTRYCANNCPYKVRRFNWFEYPHNDLLQNLVLNPDVTVRSRGVMEKCSMCVQRIEEGKIEAGRRNEPLADGDIQTACQQSCPAQAIVFGDLNDPESRLSQMVNNPRNYGVLEEFNFRPTVSYLRTVRHREGKETEGDAHV